MNLITILWISFLRWSASAAPTVSTLNMDSTTSSYEVVTQEPDSTLSEFTFARDDATNFEDNTTTAMEDELVTFETPLDETSQLEEEEFVQATTSGFVAENSNSQGSSSLLSKLFATEFVESDDVTTFGTDYVTTNTDSTSTSGAETTEYEDMWIDEEVSTQQTTESASTASTSSRLVSYRKPPKVAKNRQPVMHSGLTSSTSSSWSSSTSFSMADFKKKMRDVMTTANDIFAQYVSLFRMLCLCLH